MEKRDRWTLALFVIVLILVLAVVVGVILIGTGNWLGDPCRNDPMCHA